MAGGQERVLRRRIRSIQSTKKITRAMELIAASRIVKAQQRVAAARPYAELLTEALRSLAAAGGGGTSHPLLAQRESIHTVAYVVVTADRGLAGGYNANVLRTAERAIKADQAAGRDYVLVTCGKKAESFFRFKGYRIEAAFNGFSENPSYENARQVADLVMELFTEERVDEVELVFTQFFSVGVQRVTDRRFLPLQAESLGEEEGASDAGDDGPRAAYEFEPSPEAILERLLPAYVEARLYDAFLEAAASEHAARQRAMKSATDNAEELIKSLTRVMNRARQESITTEIMEIVGGAEALAQGNQGERVEAAAFEYMEGSN
jgi:F-type H+-transporting ATPase subunit gamma